MDRFRHRQDWLKDTLDDIIEGQQKIMAQIDDLNAAVANLTAQDVTNATDIVNALNALAAALAQQAPNLVPATTAITAAVSAMATSDKSIESALAPPPVPFTATPTSVSFANLAGAVPATVALAGGTAPYTIGVAGDATVATAAIAGNTLTVTATGVGSTSFTIDDSASPFAPVASVSVSATVVAA